MVSCFPNQESWNPRRINRRSFSPRHANSVDRKLLQEEVGAEFLTSGGFNMIQPPTAQGDLSNYITSYIRWIPTFDSYLGYLRKSKHISTKHIPWYSPVLYRFAMPKTSDFPHFFMAQPDPDPIPSSGSPRLFRKGLTHGVHFKGNLVRPCCPAVPLKDGEQLWFILMVYHSTSMCNYDYLCIHNHIYARICLKKILYFELSPPWHLYILLLANLLAFYLTYLLAFYLAYLLAICSGISSGTLSGISSGISSDILSGILSGKSSGILSGITFWHFIWHTYWHSIWHSIWHTFWHSTWHIILAFLSYFIWHIFWHSIWHIFWHSFWHIFWHSVWHIFWHSYHAFYLAYLLTFYLTSFLTFLPVEVRSAHCDLDSRGWGPAVPIWGLEHRRWGPGVPTGIWSSRLRSGSAHWDLEHRGWGPAVPTGIWSIAVEVRQCPLRPGSRGWGPEVPTAICNSRLRSGSAHWDLELAVEVRLCPLGSGLRGGGGGWGGGGGGGGEELC